MNHPHRLAAGLIALMMPMLNLPAAAQPDARGRAGSPAATAGRDTLLRAGPQGSYPQIGRIARGVPLRLYGCLNDGSWCDVGHDNDRGWIMGPDILSQSGGRQDSIANLWGTLRIGSVTFTIGDYWDTHYRGQPFYTQRSRWEDQYFDLYQDSWGPRPLTRRWPGRSGPVIGVMLRRSWLYAGPDWSYPRAGLVYPQTSVTIVGCLRDWSWCDVISRNNRGWVAGRDIAANWRGRRQSINLIAPYLGIGILSFVFQSYWNEHYRRQPFYRERDRWERQYSQTYRPTWGPGPGPGTAPANQPYQSPRPYQPVPQARPDKPVMPQADPRNQAHMQTPEQAQRGRSQPQATPRGPGERKDRKPQPDGAQ